VRVGEFRRGNEEGEHFRGLCMTPEAP
jgi:hypothetical protein